MTKYDSNSVMLGIFIGIGIAAATMALTMEFDKQESEPVEDWPVAMTTTCYLNDANIKEVSLVIQSDADLTTTWAQARGREFINSVCAMYSSEQLEEMSNRFRTDTIKFLGLDSSSMLINVGIGDIK